MHTVETRKNIGFPENKESWNQAPAVYTEHELKIAGHPVMEDWEQGYMQKLAEIATSKNGTILEVGYGLGLSARAIQAAQIDTHIVIECHPDVVRKCVTDFRDEIEKSRLHIYSGFWEDVTPNLSGEIFDGILFDTYPLREEEIHSNHFWFFREAFRLLKPGGVLTYYSDEVSDFSNNHRAKLLEAGFKNENISAEICEVNPPEDCEYWQEKTILAPVVIK